MAIGEIGRSGARAIGWNYAGVVVRLVVQFVAQILLARLLGPDVFGLVSAAMIVCGLAGVVAELGLGASLVRGVEPTSADIASVFYCTLMIASLLCATIVVLATPLADFLGDRRIADPLRWLALFPVFQALGVVPQAVLRRRFDMKRAQIASVSGYCIGFLLVGGGSAWLGFGVWSLVAAWLAMSLTTSGILLAFARTPMFGSFLLPTIDRRKFGVKVLLTNLTSWVTENVDNLMIGKAYGPIALGHYGIAYNLVRNPTNHLVNSLQTVVFPASARARNQPPLLRQGIAVLLTSLMLLAIPLFVVVAGVSSTVVQALFGDSWLGSAAILLPLALAMPAHCVTAVCGPVLWGLDRPGLELRIQFVVAVVLVLTLFAASRVSVEAMAWGVAGTYLLRGGWMLARTCRALGAGIRSAFCAIMPGAVMGAFCVAIAIFVDRVAEKYGFSAPMRLLLVAGVLMPAYPLVFRFAARRLVGADFVAAMAAVIRRMPASMRASANLVFKV